MPVAVESTALKSAEFVISTGISQFSELISLPNFQLYVDGFYTATCQYYSHYKYIFQKWMLRVTPIGENEMYRRPNCESNHC